MHDIAAAYDDIAALYDDHVRDLLAARPFERPMIDLFAEYVEPGPVADLGCGQGRVTRYLADRGLPITGMDASTGLLALARERHPDLTFREGTLEALDFADGELAGLLAWYSLIHLPPDRVTGVLSEFARVLRPRGLALLAFPATDEPVDVDAFDHRVAPAHRWSPRRLAELCRDRGLVEVCRMVRRPEPDERFDQACLLLRKEH